MSPSITREVSSVPQAAVIGPLRLSLPKGRMQEGVFRLLADAGILESSKQGRTVLYRVRYAEICRLLRSLADAFESCCDDGRANASAKGACCGTC